MAALLCVIDRPRTAPLSLLAISTSILVGQLALSIVPRSSGMLDHIPQYLAIITAAVIILIILSMPLRDPQWSSSRISTAYGVPTSDLRSPEDNLTPWQFMNVSWMSPLILLGYKRQLDDVDVWSLSFEFQHRQLHHKFRELKGSVVKRLLSANGLDLVFISVLSIVELMASSYSHFDRC